VSGHADPERARRRGCPRGAGDRGQATVEVALVLPVVVMIALAVIQVGVLLHEQLLVTAAAREAVRAAAVSTSDSDARRAAGAIGHLDPGRLTVDVGREPGDGGPVRVRLTYTARTEVPMAGALLPDIVLSASAAMRGET
jgi:Flp pilus assembly protein TadG